MRSPRLRRPAIGGIAQLLQIARSVPTALTAVLLVGASGLLSVAGAPVAPAFDVNPQQSVSDQFCLGWADSAFTAQQRVLMANAGAVDSPSLSVKRGDQEVALEPAVAKSLKLDLTEPLRITVQGEGADRVSARTIYRTDRGTGTGLAIADCAAPGQEFWFAGINTQSGSRPLLVLANPDNEDTVASLKAYTGDGEYQLTEVGRVMVRARSSRVVDLTGAVPAAAAVALRVQVAEGRVVAQVHNTLIAANEARGRSVIAGQPAPATRLVISGVQGTAIEPRLHVLAPTADAVVTVTVVSDEGSWVLADADGRLQSMGEVVSFDLKDALAGGPATVVVESDQPLVGAVTQVVETAGDRDLEVQSPQNAVSVRAVAVLPKGNFQHSLELYAAATSEVTITAYAGGEEVWQEQVSAAAGRHTSLRLSNPITPGTYLVLAPSAPVFATMWLTIDVGSADVTAAFSLFDQRAQLVPGAKLYLSLP